MNDHTAAENFSGQLFNTTIANGTVIQTPLVSKLGGTVQLACEACKRRKIKCDRRHPKCGLCNRRDKVCIYPDFRQKPGPKPINPRGLSTEMSIQSQGIELSPPERSAVESRFRDMTMQDGDIPDQRYSDFKHEMQWNANPIVRNPQNPQLVSKRQELENEQNNLSCSAKAPHTKSACNSCKTSKRKCVGDVSCNRYRDKGLLCQIASSKKGHVEDDRWMINGSFSDNPPQQTTVQVPFPAIPDFESLFYPSGVQTSSFGTCSDGDEDIEVENFFHSLFDGFNSSVKDLLHEIEIPESVTITGTPSMVTESYKPSGYDNGLLSDRKPFVADSPGLIQGDKFPTASVHISKSNEHQYPTPNSLRGEIFDTSPLFWRPTQDDHKRDTRELVSLHLSTVDHSSILRIAVTDSTRDAVVLMVSPILQQHAPNVKPIFPPLSAFNFFLSSFFNVAHQLGRAIHGATFDPNNCESILLAAMIATGAILKGRDMKGAETFAHGMLDLTRLSISNLIETDNTYARHIDLIQAYQICIAAASWTGSKRKMELAEAQRSSPLTMIRRAGWFNNSNYRTLSSILDDNKMSLRAKWEAWVMNERRKRISYYCYIWEMELATFYSVSPSVHYAQLGLPLPHSQKLWEAATAEQWYKIAGQENGVDILPGSNDIPSRERSFADYLQHFFLTLKHPKAADNFIDHLVLTVLCQHVIDLRRSSDVLEFNGSERVDRLSSHKLQSADLDHTLSSWESAVDLKNRDSKLFIFYHVCQLHLHSSIDAIEIMAGREGRAEARRVLPGLLAWVSKESSRAAAWHASQIIKHASRGVDLWIPVAVYQAALVLWAYGILDLRSYKEQEDETSNCVDLCQDRTEKVQHFIQLGLGKPGYYSEGMHIDIDHTSALLQMCIRVMENAQGCANMVTNLCRLLRLLGDSATSLTGKKIVCKY